MEKAKAFLLICAGILMLSVAVKLGTESAWADFDPEANGPMIGASGVFVLTDTGEVWAVKTYDIDDPVPIWERQVDADPPIPLQDIQFWSVNGIVTNQGDFRYRWGDTWYEMGTPPGTAIITTDWSQLKTKYGK